MHPAMPEEHQGQSRILIISFSPKDLGEAVTRAWMSAVKKIRVACRKLTLPAIAGAAITSGGLVLNNTMNALRVARAASPCGGW